MGAAADAVDLDPIAIVAGEEGKNPVVLFTKEIAQFIDPGLVEA